MNAEQLETVTRRAEVVLAGVVAGSAVKSPELNMDDFHGQLDKLEADLQGEGIPRDIVQAALLTAARRVSARIAEDAV